MIGSNEKIQWVLDSGASQFQLGMHSYWKSKKNSFLIRALS